MYKIDLLYVYNAGGIFMIKLSEYGLTNGQELSSSRLVEVIKDVKDKGHVELIWDIDGIVIKSDNAIVKELYLTNTASEKEIPHARRLVGFPIMNVSGLTIDGKGNTLKYDGRMVQMAIIDSYDITIKGFNFDYIHPTVAEFTVLNSENGYIDIMPNIDSEYTLDSGLFKFDSDIGGNIEVQECDPIAGITKRVKWYSNRVSCFESSKGCHVNDDGSIRIYLTCNCLYKKGYIYQICSVIRDGAGVFVSDSSEVSFIDNNYKFMHGMGVLCQHSKNINIDGCNFVPNKDRGRTTATFADVIHSCNCRGRLTVTNCVVDGTRDDVINVHGIHFKILGVENNRIKVLFPHAQSYGFKCFEAGDKIAVVGTNSLREKSRATIKSVVCESPRVQVLILDNKVSARKGDMVENITWTTELFVDNLACYNVPTRGILVTTRKKVVVQNSIFHKNIMASILIADDAKSWYESGMVCDVTIRNNKFVECGTYPISIKPECLGWKTVHSGIAVENNEFILSSPRLALITNTDGVVWAFNKVSGCEKPIIKTKHVRNMVRK